jgi:hypothetical protein
MEDWKIVSVESLPWPRHLFRCELAKDVIVEIVEDLELEQAATRDRVLGLSTAEVRACAFHAPDWVTAARIATDLAAAGRLDPRGVGAAMCDLDAETAWALLSFVAEPIIWNGGLALGNGQHRVCAMKIARVDRCPIVER